ncbi:MAG: B12-responsive hypothetical protein [Rhodobacteraceae bacterium HLUCCA08]|nr:MAG: B12-responsive hypothetical protein [Rhodobacteraceae bacterium HLUCCA08]
MMIDRVLVGLQVDVTDPDRAAELGRMGFIQWIGLLPGGGDYRRAALRALAHADPLAATDPAVAAFCDLLVASLAVPPRPLDLALPRARRRGGARARRALL